jgi:hypothetical protein
MEDYKHAYIKSKKDLIHEKFTNGVILEATVDEKIKNKQNVYKALIHPEHVMMYFPVMESWCHYMIPKMENETFETREIIKCVSIAVEPWKRKRKLLLSMYNHTLVERFE